MYWYFKSITCLGSGYSTAYYYWEGDTSGHFPTHDPCGSNEKNQKRNVLSAGGAIFVRGMTLQRVIFCITLKYYNYCNIITMQ